MRSFFDLFPNANNNNNDDNIARRVMGCGQTGL